MRVVDLSHRIVAGMTTYPGLPAPEITPYLTRADSRARYAPGTEFAMDVIRMIGNTGTYLDAPFHRYTDGADLAGLDLATLVDLPAEVFHLVDRWSPERRGIEAETLADRELHGAAVLLHTGWDRLFGLPEYGHGAPFLTEAAARFLVEAGVALVGIDSVNIDDVESGGSRPAHSVLLGAGVHVVEHLPGSVVYLRGARASPPPRPRSRDSAPSRCGPTRPSRMRCDGTRTHSGVDGAPSAVPALPRHLVGAAQREPDVAGGHARSERLLRRPPGELVDDEPTHEHAALDLAKLLVDGETEFTDLHCECSEAGGL